MDPIIPGADKQKPHPISKIRDQVGLQRLPNRTGSGCLLDKHHLPGFGVGFARYDAVEVHACSQ